MPLAIEKTFTNGSGDHLWSNASNWSPAVAPIAADDIVIPAGSAYIDCTGMSAAAFGSLYVAPGASERIGASGARLTGSFANGIIHHGSGKLWLSDDSSGPSTPIFICSTGNGDVADLDSASGGFGQIEVLRGQVNIAGSAANVITTLIIGYVSNQLSDASVTVVAGAGTTTSLYQWGGVVIANQIVTTGVISGGIFVKRSTTAMTTLVAANAQAYYEGTGTLTTLLAGAGSIVDFDRNYSDADGASKGRQAAVTISNSYTFPGATVRRNSRYLTFTNPDQGGFLRLPPGGF